MSTSTSTHHFAEGLGILRELAGILLLHLPHQPLHFLPLNLFLPLLERRLALDHLVQQAAQRPPVRGEGVALILHHLWSCRRDFSSRDFMFHVLKQGWRTGQTLTHVSHCPHPSLDGLSLWYMDG